MSAISKPASSDLSYVDGFVREYFSLREKTLQSLLEICRVVYRAKSELNRKTFKTFIEKVGLTSDGSVSKMVSIGQRYSQFKRHEDSLPSAWTTVYRLTQIDEKTVEELVESQVIHPAVTAAELKPYLPTAAAREVSVMSAISIQFERDLDPETRQTIRSLIEQLKKCGCEIKKDNAAEVLEMI
uniref:hypothetical protein n=1 Tax=Rheinheimera sp. TaxID=1869214 RepID=UPI004047A89C